jgi:nitrite reductase (NADH) large subunit
VVAAPAVPFADSVHGGLGIDRLWRESALRQATGFTTLGLGIASLGLPLRKRSRFLARVSQARWRTVHAGLGVATLVGFGVHTGLRLGANLDRALALCFVALAGLGALAGLVTAIERRLGATAGARLRRAATWAHVLALWPFPLLILFHVLKVYWY